MSEYLVRWKFAANSLLNKRDVETEWHMQFHPNKNAALDHYINYLRNTPPAYEMTIEVVQLVKLHPGEPEPEEISVNQVGPNKTTEKIVKLFEKGYTRKAIAEELDVSYQTVCKILRNA